MEHKLWNFEGPSGSSVGYRVRREIGHDKIKQVMEGLYIWLCSGAFLL